MGIFILGQDRPGPAMNCRGRGDAKGRMAREKLHFLALFFPSTCIKWEMVYFNIAWEGLKVLEDLGSRHELLMAVWSEEWI